MYLIWLSNVYGAFQESKSNLGDMFLDLLAMLCVNVVDETELLGAA